MTSYERFSDYVGDICSSNNLSDFKSNPNFTYMLEHVSKKSGGEYLQCILHRTSIPKDMIIEFCNLNDSVGSPMKEHYDKLDTSVSPSSLRYIYQSHLILTHIKNSGISDTNAIEVGGGYGGLCLALHFFANIYGVRFRSYTICDLTNIIRLQGVYLKTIAPTLNIEFADANTYGENIHYEDMFLISNYCFSEISKEHRDLYQQKLFPNVTHGFIAWNHIPIYDFGFTLHVEPEIPNSREYIENNPIDNAYVYF